MITDDYSSKRLPLLALCMHPSVPQNNILGSIWTTLSFFHTKIIDFTDKITFNSVLRYDINMSYEQK